MPDIVYERVKNGRDSSFTSGIYVAFTDSRKTAVIMVATTDVAALPEGEVTLTGTEDRSGYWVSLIMPGSVQKLQAGLQYLGLSARWALRFSYLDSVSRSRETMVLAFAEEGLRSQVRAELEKSNTPPGPPAGMG